MSAVSTETVQAISTAPARQRPLRHWNIWLLRLGLVVLCIVIILPAFWVVTASVEPGSSAFTSSLFPTRFTLDNYTKVFNQGFLTWLKNSLIVGVSAAVVQLVVNTLGAYAFSRLRFPGKQASLMALVLIQIWPQVLGIAAIYALLVTANLLDTLPGLCLVYIGGSAFYMWLLKNYMDSLPRELDESATVDGANSWQIFWQVIMPLIRPMLVTIFILSFTGIYNDFILASTILQTPDSYTITVGLEHLVYDSYATNWALFAAGAVMASLPILIIFLSLQKQLVSGLAQGSVKG